MPPAARLRRIDWRSWLLLLLRVYLALNYGLRGGILVEHMDFFPQMMGMPAWAVWALAVVHAIAAVALLTGLWCRPAIILLVLAQLVFEFAQGRAGGFADWLSQLVQNSNFQRELVFYALLSLILLLGPGRFVLPLRRK